MTAVGRRLELEVEIEGVQLSPVSATFAATSFEDAVKYGRKLCGAIKYGPWWVGAWVNWLEDTWLKTEAGKREYGVKYKAALLLTGLDIQTLKNCSVVDRAVDVYRRRYELSWSHHGVVCALEAKDQDKFLALAIKHGWSRADLRKALRKAGKQEADEPIIDVGFIPTAYVLELKRGWQGDIERFGPVAKWAPEVREGWKRALRVAYDLYNQL